MKPLTIKSPSQQSETPKLSIDMAEQIADRAARRAADETATRVSQEVNRENMESFNRFQEQNSQQNSQQVSQQVPQQNVETEETSEVDIDVFNSGTSKSIKNFVSAYKGLNEIFSPPADPTRVAIESAMSNLLSEFVTNRLGGGGGTGVASHKPSFLIDVLNTAAAHGFGEKLGDNLPQVIQSLSGVIGRKKTEELVDNINSKMNSGGGNSENNNSSDVEKQKDTVLALDSNNSEHVSQYAKAMGLTEKAAKGMLQLHKDDIINERKIFSNSNSETTSGSNNEITQALAILIQEMTGMKTVINNLQNELISMKGNNISENVDVVNESEISNVDDRWNDNESSKISVSTSPVGGQNRNVTLFQSPIKVDIDDIKGNSDPFFSEKQKQHSDSNVKTNITTKKIEYDITEEQEKQKESILEETKDSKGNSSFKMSGEQPKIPEKNIDKKEENSSVELKEPDKTITRKIVKKIIPIKKVDEIVNKVEEVSKKVEHYDINNNLIMED